MCFDDCPFRDQAVLQIAPKGNRQLAGQGDDHDAPHALGVTLGALAEPLAQGRLWLMPEPRPSRLDHDMANPAVAGLGNALAASALAAVIGAGCQADRAGDLAPVSKPPVIDLTSENGGGDRANTIQA